MKKISLRERIKYRFDSFVSKGTMAMITGLAVITLFTVILFAFVLLAVGIHPDHQIANSEFGAFESIWVNLTHMLDPGTVGEHEDNWPFQIFMMMVTILGLVVVSTLIGLVSNGILTKLEVLRKGRSFVIERDHVLILGWSSKIFTIIRELVEANENQKRGVIVILADMDKVLMEDEMKDKVGNTKNTRVICRTGNPIDIHDLEIANPYESKSIIILDKDNENSDSQTIKAIVAIVTHPKRRAGLYHITAEMEDRKNFNVAKMVGGKEVEIILSDEIISRIMVQTSRQSGLSVVYQDLMDFAGDEIYFAEAPSLYGKTFREVLSSYEDSAIMGIQYGDNTVEINPPMDTLFREGDKVIGITKDDDTLVANSDSDSNVKFDDSSIVYTEPTSGTPEKILIVGWNNRAKYVLRELDNYVPKESSVKVVSKFEFDNAKKVIKKINGKVQNISIEFEAQDTTDRETLQEMGLDNYDFIILLCYQNYFPIQEADAQTLITLLHLRNFSEQFGDKYKYKIVSEMLDIRNRQLADITSADDFIVSDTLLSLLMSQVSENKYLMRVFEDLFDADGSEIYIKPAREYVKVGAPIDFYTLLESAARKNEVAIGYRTVSNAKNPDEQYGVVLNPKKSDSFTLACGDTVIVLSED